MAIELHQITETLWNWGELLGPLLLRAVIVFAVGAILRKLLLGALCQLMEKNKLDAVQVGFFRKVVGVTLWLIVGLVVMTQIGIETTSLIAVVGAAGLGIGLALKDSLQNLASGFMLITLRPFRAGDVVEISGQIAKVDQISVFTTHLTTLDNKKLFLPNSEVFGKPLLNFTGNDTRRIDLNIRVAYRENLQRVQQLIRTAVSRDERVLEEPELFIGVGELSPNSVDLVVRAWVASPDWWPTRCALLQLIKEELEEAGVEIPFPQIDVHLDR